MENDLYIKKNYINSWGNKVTAYYTLSLSITVELTHEPYGTPGFTKIKSKNGFGNDSAFNAPVEDTPSLVAIFKDIEAIQAASILKVKAHARI